jgi:hypothetical protein
MLDLWKTILFYLDFFNFIIHLTFLTLEVINQGRYDLFIKFEFLSKVLDRT